jgi:uncharacterized protein YuzE
MVEIRKAESVDTDQIRIPDLKFDKDLLVGSTWSYDKRRDILFVYRTPKRPDVSYDVGGHFWVRFDPETGNVVGVEVEDFEKVFLIRYPELAIGWQELRPTVTKRLKRQSTPFDEYLRLLYQWVQEALSHHPQQLQMAPL